MRNVLVFFLVSFCCQLHCVKCHLLSSNIDIRVLATQTVSELHKFISLHIIDEGQQMQQSQRCAFRDRHLVSRYLSAYQLVLREANEDVENYLANPVNEYLLIKLTSEWPTVKDSINQQYTITGCNSNSVPQVSDNILELLPTIKDVRDAALGLVRLQTTYALATRDLAEGKHLISAEKYSSSHHQMTAGDCWEIGRQAYLIGEDETAMSWMEESLRRYHQEAEKTVPIVDIIKYYAFSSYENGDNALSLNLTLQLIELIPGGQTELKKIFESETKLRSSHIDDIFYDYHDQTYKALCRGEKLMDAFTESQLDCTYTSSKEMVPFLKLQPIKREHISLNPPIIVFHDVISDKEIELLKEIAQPMMSTGLRGNSEDNSSKQETVHFVANYTVERVVTNLHADNYLVLEKLDRRIQDITALQLTNKWSYMFIYGIGGHMTPHFDFLQADTLTPEQGVTIATLLLYLNEVESGGATAFPEAKTIIKPVKGSFSMWINLLPNGQGNLKSLHAACPVLAGSKWVIAKTIGLKGQEFRRPCRLDENAEV